MYVVCILQLQQHLASYLLSVQIANFEWYVGGPAT